MVDLDMQSAGPVSLPSPTFYAHLVCFRARSYMNSLRNKDQNMSKLDPNAFDAHESLQRFMYFS
jgi:hypothetical protein